MAISPAAGQIACLLLLQLAIDPAAVEIFLQYLNGCTVRDMCMINGENTNNFFIQQ